MIRTGEVTYKGVPLEAMFNYCPAYKGLRENGLQITPDDEEAIEIEDICAGSISIIDMLEQKQIDAVEELIWESIKE